MRVERGGGVEPCQGEAEDESEDESDQHQPDAGPAQGDRAEQTKQQPERDGRHEPDEPVVLNRERRFILPLEPIGGVVQRVGREHDASDDPDDQRHDQGTDPGADVAAREVEADRQDDADREEDAVDDAPAHRAEEPLPHEQPRPDPNEDACENGKDEGDRGERHDERDLLEDLAELGLEQLDMGIDQSERGRANVAERLAQSGRGLVRLPGRRLGRAGPGAGRRLGEPDGGVGEPDDGLGESGEGVRLGSSLRGRPRFAVWASDASTRRREHTKRRCLARARCRYGTARLPHSRMSVGTECRRVLNRYAWTMSLPTEPIGSLPRSKVLQDGMTASAAGQITPAQLDALFDDAVRDTIRRFEETGSPVITDGEQRKPSFATYPVAGLKLAGDGVVIPFEDGHTRQLPVLTEAPFRYATKAYTYLDQARPYAHVPLKQAVISASAISLMYPGDGIPGYSREAFLDDLVSEAADELRGIIARGATAQIDFTEARLSLKLDPSGGLLNAFVDLNNRVLAQLTDEERAKVGLHTCPGGDQDSTHSADVDYADLLPSLFRMNVDRFFVELAGEADHERELAVLGPLATGSRRIFVGVIDPINPRIETAEEVRDRILEAARFIDPAHLGTTDDCGFSPFGDDTSTSRDTAFAKIRARVEGTELASQALGV